MGNSKSHFPYNPPQYFHLALPKTTDLHSPAIEQRMNDLNLISILSDEQLSDDLIQKMYVSKQQKEKKITLQNTAHIMKTLGQLNTPNIHNVFSSGVYSGFLKTIMSGKYSYLTHLMCSTACFFFWMTPNANKMRLIRPNSKRDVVKSAKMKKENDDVEMSIN